MNILVVDSDTGLQEYYTQLMESEFQNVSVSFQSSAKSALEYIPSHEVDIVITESNVEDMNVFDFIETLVARFLPVIVISAESTERLIVESLRAGALDFVSKNSIKLGLVPRVITRALLEADRWSKVQKYAAGIPHREAWRNLNRAVRDYLYAERQERLRNSLYKSEREQERVFIEGNSYHIIYLYLQLIIPESLRSELDERVYLKIQNRLLDKCIAIVPKYGGSLWTRKEDAAFFAFSDDDYLPALLAAMEIRANTQLSAFAMENHRKPIGIRIGMSGSKTTYREDKSQIYSEGLNLSAHLANYFPAPNAILVTSEFYEHLNPRSRKYFFRVPEAFEGHTIYKFEYVS